MKKLFTNRFNIPSPRIVCYFGLIIFGGPASWANKKDVGNCFMLIPRTGLRIASPKDKQRSQAHAMMKLYSTIVQYNLPPSLRGRINMKTIGYKSS